MMHYDTTTSASYISPLKVIFLLLCSNAIFLRTTVSDTSPTDASLLLISKKCGDLNVDDLTPAVASLLCAVERGNLFIDQQTNSLVNAGCLIGKPERCSTTKHVPTEAETPASPPPPDAKIEEYQKIATVAESYIDQNWWRKGFASDDFLLSHNDAELPTAQYTIKKLRHKKLKNMLQCVTRQQFIRKSYDLSSVLDASKFDNEEKKQNCTAMSHPDVILFLQAWKKDSKKMFGGAFKHANSPDKGWEPVHDHNTMRESSLNVLGVFYDDYGGIWTGSNLIIIITITLVLITTMNVIITISITKTQL